MFSPTLTLEGHFIVPGPINEKEELEKLLVTDQFLRHNDDSSKNTFIRTSVKENEDFVILPDNAWQYLFKLYGGTDVPRVSIEVEKDSEAGGSEHIIEIYL